MIDTTRSTAKRGFYRKPGGPRCARLALLLSIAVAPGCAGLNVFTVEEDAQLGAEAYAQILQGERVLTSGPGAVEVQEVMQDLVLAADTEGLPWEWEVSLLEAPETVNAFCLPGGKMAVYSGILPVTADEQGLAVVMGHEIAHALERHGTERLTRQMGTQVVLELLGAGDYQELGMLAAQLAIELPYGRGDELEADRVGLFLMADAGYDPREAVAFWGRMAQLGGGGGPEWLSTHPSDQTRMAELEALLPEAMSRYQAAGGP
jgi:predicted Zn-dependent protease